MRYAGQGFEVNVPLDEKALTRHDAVALQHAFDARYEERFGRNLGAVPVEVVSWRVRLVAPPSVDRDSLPEHRARRTAGEALIEHRMAYFTELDGFVDTPVYARARLVPGTKIAGPALIEEAEIDRPSSGRRPMSRSIASAISSCGSKIAVGRAKAQGRLTGEGKAMKRLKDVGAARARRRR